MRPTLFLIAAAICITSLVGCQKSPEQEVYDCSMEVSKLSGKAISERLALMVACMRARGYELEVSGLSGGANIYETEGRVTVYMSSASSYQSVQSNSVLYYVVGIYCLLGIATVLSFPVVRMIQFEVNKQSHNPPDKLKNFKRVLYFFGVLLWPFYLLMGIIKRKEVLPNADGSSGEEVSALEGVMKAMEVICDEGIDADEFPNGVDSFGRVASNPIPTRTILGTLTYLSKLRTTDGALVKSQRIGALEHSVSAWPIDQYRITSQSGANLGDLYFSPYQKRNSRKAPENFVLLP